MWKKFNIFIILPLIIIISIFPLHSGKTDGNGGHYNQATDDYHYHHGYTAHDHYDIDGDGIIDCPYEFDDNTNHSIGNWNSGNGDSKKITFKDIVTVIFEIIGRLLIGLFLAYLFSWGIMELIEKKAKERLSDHTFDVIWKIFFFSIATIVIVVTLLIVLYSNEIL